MPVYGMPTALESSLNTLLQQRQPSSWRVSGHSDDITVVLRWTKTDWVYAKDWAATPNHNPKASALSYASSFDDALNSNNNNINNNSNNNNNNNSNSKYQEQKSATTASHNANCSKKHKRKHSSSSSSSSCHGKDPHHVSTTSRSRHNSNSVSKRDKGSKSVIQSYATPPHAHQEADPYPVFVTSAESLNRTTSGHGFIQDDNNVNNKVNHDNEMNNYRIENKDGKEHVIKISKVYTDRYLADAQYHYHHHQQHQQKQQQQHSDLYTRSSSTPTNSTHANNHYTNSFKADGKSGHKGSISSSNKDSLAIVDGRRHAPQSPTYFYNAVAQALQKEPTSPGLGSDKVQRGNASSSSSSSSSSRSARIHRQASFDNGGGTLLEREAASSFQSDDDEELDMICSAGTTEHNLEVDDHDMKG